MKIAVVTDNSSGISLEEKNKYSNLYIINIPYYLDETEYSKEFDEREEFYKLLDLSNNVHTSQPSPDIVLKLWDELLKEYDYIIHIPISSGLSGSLNTAQMLANEEEYLNKVYVLDLQRISLPLKISVFEALDMIKHGFTALEIKDYLTRTKYENSIYISVPNLKYLKKGGRLTKEVALLAAILQIKPVLQINGGLLESYKKTHSKKQSMKVLRDALKKDIDTRFKDLYDTNQLVMCIAYSDNYDDALILKDMLLNEYKGLKIYTIDPLCLPIACHIGRGGLGVAISRIRKELL